MKKAKLTIAQIRKTKTFILTDLKKIKGGIIITDIQAM